MADSLTPWIAPHLMESGERYGAQIYTIPYYEKRKKVQITEFLTFVNENQETYIWARVSDKQHIIPIKFTKEAVADFHTTSHTRLTQHKGAIVTIKKFKPIFSRLPGLEGGRSTKESYLALECESVSLLGSSGEATFGNPKSITTNPDLKLWSNGLNQAGGAGNILKERKQTYEVSKAATPVKKQTHMLPPLPISSRPQVVASEKKVQPLRTVKVTDLASYNARWQAVEKNPSYRHPPEQSEVSKFKDVVRSGEIPESSPTPESKPVQTIRQPEHASQDDSPLLEEEEEEEINDILQSQRSRSGTPLSSWGSSPPAPKAYSGNGAKSSSIKSANTASSNVLPTPAQRIKYSIITPDSVPTSSSFPLGNETLLLEPSSQVANEREVRPVPRKVPRPLSPQPRRHTSGPERVLAPNSDTSGTQSQSLTQSQSQSQPRVHEREIQVASWSPRDNALQQADEEIRDAAMDIDEGYEEKRRRSKVSNIKLGSPSPRGNRSMPVMDSDGRTFAGGEHSSSSSTSSSRSGNEERRESESGSGAEGGKAEGSDDTEYPWLSLGTIRGIIIKAEGLRRGLGKDVIT